MDLTAHVKATEMIQQHLNSEVERLRRAGVCDHIIRAQLRVLVDRALRSEERELDKLTKGNACQ